MNWLSSFLHPEKGYQKGQEQLDKYFGQSQDLYNQAQDFQKPYNQNGLNQTGNLNEVINNLLNPQSLQDQWTKGYQESESAKNAENIAQEHGLNSAGAQGLLGSNSALNAIQKGTSQIGLNDRQNYLDQLMKKYLAGAGISQNIYGQGANAATHQGQNALTQGQNALNQGQNSANLAYGEQNAGGNILQSILGNGIGLAASAAGGPIGGALAKRWNLAGGGS